MRYFFLGAAVASVAVPCAAWAQDSEQRIAWNKPSEPFRIADNVYYVGTSGLSAYLITGSAGHVLIDGGLPESAALIASNVEKLGFRLKDIEYLLINHAHFDHAGGLAQLKRLTSAKLVAIDAEKADLEAGNAAGRPELPGFEPIKVDKIIADGGELRLGKTVLTAHWTPGHTKGCTSWSGRAADRTVLFACSLTVAGQKLAGDPAYPNAAEDFRRSHRALRSIKADIFLNFHPEFFELEAKRARQLKGEPDAFVDPGELGRQVDRAERSFKQELKRQQAQ